MIQSFADERTQRIFNRLPVKGISQQLQRKALRKLLILDAADSLQDLRVLPGNRLEKLKGDRQGQYSIRVDSQWRICFFWKRGDASETELVDYH